MIIKSKFKDYELLITKSASFFENLIMENAFYVIDKNVYNLYPHLFKEIESDVLYILEAVEENKTIDVALSICEKITALAAKRNAVLVSCGGGIVQDVTGFVANVMYRGIKWIFVPTTLLASCDSCIGGKTSLNYKNFKNLLGTFYPPDNIFIDPDFFKTLTELDFTSGLGEVVKFNVMTGFEGIKYLEDNIDLLLRRDKDALLKAVETSLLFKKTFIEADEFDKGERILLNFAHTFGHAFEVSSEYNIPHGTAVAIGMMVANQISFKRNILSKEIVNRIENLVVRIVLLELKREWFSIELIINAIKKDKKQTGAILTAILLNDSFDLLICNDISEGEISEAVDYVFNMLRAY